MPLNLNSNTTSAAFSGFDTETVTITRQSKGASPGQFTTTTIYSGSGDLQQNTGSTYMGVNGTVITADADLTLEPVSGILPAVQPGDLVAYNGLTYTVGQVASWTYPIKHVSAFLKLGTQNMKPLK